MPTSLMGALCSLVGQLGDKIEGLNEHLAAKFVGEQGRGFVGRCPLHLWALTSNSPPSARSSKATESTSQGQPSKSSWTAVNYKSWAAKSLTFRRTVGSSNCINKKAWGLILVG